MSSAPKPYFAKHIFFCTNQREADQACCGNHRARQAQQYCKQAVKAAGLAGVGGVRVNGAGCLDRCAGGPVCVVYPQGVWYTYVDEADIDEIVASHLKDGRIVERLLLPEHIGS